MFEEPFSSFLSLKKKEEEEEEEEIKVSSFFLLGF
jgi:hypothetical protein